MIKVKLMGGLGNQMFQYALGKKLAIQNNTDSILDLTFLNSRMPGASYVFRNYDLDIFSMIKPKITFLSKISKHFPNTAYVLQTIVTKIGLQIDTKHFIKEKTEYKFDQGVMDSGKNSYILGYWQNEKYFKDIQDVIRHDFSQFTYPMSDQSKKLLEEIQGANAVCVNFRRTDYLTIKTFIGDTDGNYYDNAVKLMGEKVQNPHLFVFSDDIEWCKENFKSSFPITFVDHSYAGKKFSDYFQLMIACKHYIIPNSTFAWWAAWLNASKNKIVIAPKGLIQSDYFDSSDIIPEEWIRI